MYAGRIKKDAYRTIYSSDNFPAVALGWAYNLKPELQEKVREAFTTFKFAGKFAGGRGSRHRSRTVFGPVDYKDDFRAGAVH